MKSTWNQYKMQKKAEANAQVAAETTAAANKEPTAAGNVSLWG